MSGQNGAAEALAAAMDAERARNLRWLGWLRVVSAAAGAVLQSFNAFARADHAARLQLPLVYAHVPISLGFVYLAYRSAWYQRIGWFQIGGYDFLQLFAVMFIAITHDSEPSRQAGFAMVGFLIYFFMVSVSGFLMVRHAIIGAVASALPCAIGLLHLGGRDDFIPFAIVLLGGSGAAALYLQLRMRKLVEIAIDAGRRR